MKNSLTPKDLQNTEEFEFLAEVPHDNLKEFVVKQVLEENYIIRHYSAYQLTMLIVFAITLVRAILLFNRGINEAIAGILWGVLFSFTGLVIIHEFLHYLTYLFCGSRQLSIKAQWKKFIFYVVAHKQVVKPKAFRLVALAPLVVIKIVAITFTIFYWPGLFAYFALTVICLHTIFCAGDVAMIAFYQLHQDKEIYNYDDIEKRTTYFYFRKKL